MKWIALLTFGATVGVGFVTFDSQELAERLTAKPEPPAPPIEETVRLIFAAGIVEGTVRDTELQFEIQGRVESIPVEEGDIVRQGDILAQLDDATQRHRVSRAKAALTLAEASRQRLINAARKETRQVADAAIQVAEVRVSEALLNLHRGEKLVARKAISTQEWDDLQLAYQTARAELALKRAEAAEIQADARADDIQVADAKVTVARAELQDAKTMLEKAQMVAPIDGVILKIDGDEGELHGPNSASALVTMTNVEERRVRAFVEELDALQVAVGQRAFVTADSRPDERFEGTVVSCLPFMVRKKNRTNEPDEHIDVKVREVLIALDDGSPLVVGLPVEVYIDRTTSSENDPDEEE